MLRALVLALIAVAPACSKSEGSSPAIVAGATAGKVVDISGKVTATRDGKSRDLKQGDDIAADDVIETAADAKISIELLHNNARWNLGASKKSKVSESTAWTLAKADKPAEVNTGDTSAAGRHNEKSATETAATAEAKAAAAPASPEPAMAAAPPMADPEAAAAPKSDRPARAVMPSAPGAPANTAPPPVSAPSVQPTPTPAPPPPPPPPKMAVKSPAAPTAPTAPKTERKHDEIDQLLEGSTAPKPSEVHTGKAPDLPDSAAIRVSAQQTFAKLRSDAELKKCLGAIKSVTMKVKCSNNACTLDSVTTLDVRQQKCVIERLKEMKLQTVGAFTGPVVIDNK